MLNTDIHGLVLHVGLEDASFVVSLLLSNTIEGLWIFVWSYLCSNWRCCIISLIQLPSKLVRGISRSFRNWPMRFIWIDACERAFFRVIRSWSNYFWCGIELYERVKPFNCSSGVQAVLRVIRYLWFQIRDIFWSWCHFILLLIWGKLNRLKTTLESPPNLVLPLCYLLALSASLKSTWM